MKNKKTEFFSVIVQGEKDKIRNLSKSILTGRFGAKEVRTK
jgi:hypothetical protein